MSTPIENAVNLKHTVNVDWVDRLAEELDLVAKSTTGEPTIALQSVDPPFPRLSSQSYNALAEKATSDHKSRVIFDAYLPKPNSDLDETIAILRSHPTIGQELHSSGGEEAIMMVTPNGGFRVDMPRLVWHLTWNAIKLRDATVPAAALAKYLSLSDKNLLPGYEITLFLGIDVGQRFDIGEGAFIAPYGEIVDLGLLKEEENLPWGDFVDFRELRAAALVRKSAWGPGIRPPFTSRTPAEEMVPDVKFTYLNNLKDSSIVIDLLTILTRCQLNIVSIRYRCAEFMENIDSNFNSGTGNQFLGLPAPWRYSSSRKLLEVADVKVLSEFLNLWDHENPKLEHVARRLATSVSRRGRFGPQDSVLDLAIALESMYEITTELTFKLATRAGYFIGSSAEDRKKIFDDIVQFYRVRSDIVHGRQVNKQNLRVAVENGFAMARETLLNLLRVTDPTIGTLWS